MFYFYGIIIESILYGLEIRECFYNAICLGVTFPIYLIFFVWECCIILIGITRWPSNFDPVSVLWVFPWWYGVTPAQCILCTYWIIIVRVQVFLRLGWPSKHFRVTLWDMVSVVILLLVGISHMMIFIVKYLQKVNSCG